GHVGRAATDLRRDWWLSLPEVQNHPHATLIGCIRGLFQVPVPLLLTPLPRPSPPNLSPPLPSRKNGGECDLHFCSWRRSSAPACCARGPLAPMACCTSCPKTAPGSASPPRTPSKPTGWSRPVRGRGQ